MYVYIYIVYIQGVNDIDRQKNQLKEILYNKAKLTFFLAIDVFPEKNNFANNYN